MVPHLCRALVAPLVGLVGELVLVLLHHLALTCDHHSAKEYCFLWSSPFCTFHNRGGLKGVESYQLL